MLSMIACSLSGSPAAFFNAVSVFSLWDCQECIFSRNVSQWVGHRTFLIVDQSVRFSSAQKGDNKPSTTEVMAVSAWGNGTGVIRTTKRAVVVSETPYRRKASVI